MNEKDASLSEFLELDEDSQIAWQNPADQDDEDHANTEDSGETQPPYLQQRGTIYYSHPNRGRRKAGLLTALMNREESRPEDAPNPKAYYKPVDPDAHFHRALESYCISITALRDCKQKDVELILIGEKDTNRVLEFTLADYLHGEDVPEHYRASSADPQKHVPAADARYVWPDHRGKLFHPRSEWSEDSAREADL